VRRILILKAGQARADVIPRHGDYEQWFQRAFGGPAERFAVHGAFAASDGLPDLGAFDALVVSGSPDSVCAYKPWMGKLAEATLRAAGRGTPVLGVCFGHQLLSHALGARVEPNPRGWEIGTVEVELTPAGRTDPLFEGLPHRFAVQESHQDAVVEAPPGAELLATNPHTPVQALRFPALPALRTVQFHPELSAEAMRATLVSRGQQAEVRDRDEGTRILSSFERNFGPR
jgi:GMP synthase (glutamine-hydrolysing)